MPDHHITVETRLQCALKLMFDVDIGITRPSTCGFENRLNLQRPVINLRYDSSNSLKGRMASTVYLRFVTTQL